MFRSLNQFESLRGPGSLRCLETLVSAKKSPGLVTALYSCTFIVYNHWFLHSLITGMAMKANGLHVFLVCTSTADSALSGSFR